MIEIVKCIFVWSTAICIGLSEFELIKWIFMNSKFGIHTTSRMASKYTKSILQIYGDELEEDEEQPK